MSSEDLTPKHQEAFADYELAIAFLLVLLSLDASTHFADAGWLVFYAVGFVANSLLAAGFYTISMLRRMVAKWDREKGAE